MQQFTLTNLLGKSKKMESFLGNTEWGGVAKQFFSNNGVLYKCSLFLPELF